MQLELPLVAVGTDDLAFHAESGVLRTSEVPLPAPPAAALVPPGSVEFVRHPRARRYLLRVRSDGTVRVTIPRRGSRREGEDFVRRQARWIEKQRARIAQEKARPCQAALPPEIQRHLLERAKTELPARLLELAAVHQLRVTRVTVRNQRWRWGSCSRLGHICLNWRLVQMPPSVRDYVMIHELMHLKRLDHSPVFWKLVAAACPDHEAARAWLRRFGR